MTASGQGRCWRLANSIIIYFYLNLFIGLLAGHQQQHGEKQVMIYTISFLLLLFHRHHILFGTIF